MTSSIQLLNQAVSEEPSNRQEYRWEDLLAAIEDIVGGDSLTWEGERLLLRVLRFDGELRLSEDSEPPHSMSPEELLKSVAIQSLAKETGLDHLLEMQRVEATAASPVLASIVRATIRETAPPELLSGRLELVAEVRTAPRTEFERGPLGIMIGQQPPKSPQKQPKVTVSKEAYYTRYGVGVTPSKKKSYGSKVIIFENGLTLLSDRRRRRRWPEEQPAPAIARKRSTV